jgi:hypothetical protein
LVVRHLDFDVGPLHAIQAGSGPPVARWPVRNQVVHQAAVERHSAQVQDAVAGRCVGLAHRWLAGRDPGAVRRGGAVQARMAAGKGAHMAMAVAALAGQARLWNNVVCKIIHRRTLGKLLSGNNQNFCGRFLLFLVHRQK